MCSLDLNEQKLGPCAWHLVAASGSRLACVRCSVALVGPSSDWTPWRTTAISATKVTWGQRFNDSKEVSLWKLIFSLGNVVRTLYFSGLNPSLLMCNNTEENLSILRNLLWIQLSLSTFILQKKFILEMLLQQKMLSTSYLIVVTSVARDPMPSLP